MSSTRQLYELARRDFSQRARSRAFLISTLITVGLVLAAGPLIAFVNSGPNPSVVAAVGDLSPEVRDALATEAAALEIEIIVENHPNLEAAEKALDEGAADVLVVDGAELVWRDEPNRRLAAAIVAAFSSVERSLLAGDLGLTSDDLARLMVSAELGTRVLVEPDPEAEPRRVAAFISLIVLYFSILMFGQFVLMGVMEEKQNRVVEVVLSRVTPTQVLTGKIIGVGLLGIIQVLILGGAALGVFTVIDLADVDLSALGLEIIGVVLFWYLLGYTFYSVMYGALGATVSRQEDMQGAVLVPVMLIVPGFFFGQIAAESPDALLARIGSLVPMWSPMVMPVRAAVSDVPTWEVVLAIGIVVVSVYGLVRLGGRIYTGAILKLGSKVRLRDAWRASNG